MERSAVLVVDDDEAVRAALEEALFGRGFQVRTAGSGDQALEMLAGNSFDAVLLDVVMPHKSGLEVLQRYRSQGGTAPVLVLSALGGAEDVVRALRMGATDYLAKPVQPAELETALLRALGRLPAKPAVDRAPEVLADDVNPEERAEQRQLISISTAMRRAQSLVDRIADTDVPVLLLGESGTGKEVIAREIHQRSRRRTQPFIKVNCAALPGELLESELFGHERGAFTGATAEKPGKFELAHKGTIFLDEIGEMAIRLQAKLLQVLQDEEFFRVGGKKSVRVDSRVVVATNRELEKEIAAGNFREDLFYRLNVVAIRLAPLRDRKEDIPPLVEHFLARYGRKYRQGTVELPAEVLQAFMRYEWPGNVRELENTVRRLVVLKDPNQVLEELRAGPRSQVAPPPLPVSAVSVVPVSAEPNRLIYANPFAAPQPPPPPPSQAVLDLSLKDIGKRAAMLAEREAILSMLQRTGWNKRKAATKLRISYKALLYKIKESGIIDPRANAEL